MVFWMFIYLYFGPKNHGIVETNVNGKIFLLIVFRFHLKYKEVFGLLGSSSSVELGISSYKYTALSQCP